MPRPTLAVILSCLLLAEGCWGRGRDAANIEQQIRSVKPDQPVEIRLTKGSKLRGWVTETADSEFELTQETRSRLVKNRFAFSDVAAFKVVRSVRPNHLARNIGIGVAVGVGLVAIAALAISKSGAITW